MERVLVALVLAWSGAAAAEVTANAGLVSEYLLRGIEGSGGAAVQGGVDWAGASGLYAGTWASNLGGPAAAGGTELDLYAGWTSTLGPVRIDVQLYYATDFYGDANEAAANSAGVGNEGLYVNAIGTLPLSATLDLVTQLGHSSGNGVEVAYGDRYADYGVSLIKALDGGLSFSFGVYDTTLKQGQGFGTLPAGDDAPKAVIGVKKAFAL